MTNPTLTDAEIVEMLASIIDNNRAYPARTVARWQLEKLRTAGLIGDGR